MTATTRACFTLVGLSLLGCSQRPVPAPLPSPRLQQVARLYLWYAATHGQQGPANRETFSRYIQALDPATLASLRIDTNNPTELLTSPRDHQQFKITYGLSLSTPYRTPPLLACEQSGADGTRQLVYLSGQFRELPENEVAKLLRGK